MEKSPLQKLIDAVNMNPMDLLGVDRTQDLKDLVEAQDLKDLKEYEQLER